MTAHEEREQVQRLKSLGRLADTARLDVKPFGMSQHAYENELVRTNLCDHVRIGEFVTIYRGAQLGDYVNVGDYASIRERVNILDQVNIGCYTRIEPNCMIGRNVKIQAHCYLAPLTIIHHSCFIGIGVVFTDDKSMGRDPDRAEKKKSAIVMAGVRIGSNTTINAGIVIGENALVGMGSVVTKDVPANMIVQGNPARWVGDTPEEDRI